MTGKTLPEVQMSKKKRKDNQRRVVKGRQIKAGGGGGGRKRVVESEASRIRVRRKGKLEEDIQTGHVQYVEGA